MREGFYSARFKGAGIGDGFAIFVFMNGTITGASSNHATYDGEYAIDPDTGVIDLSFTVNYPPGAGPKAKENPPALGWGVDLKGTLPADFEGKPQIGNTPFGLIEVVYVFIRGLPGEPSDDD